MTDFPYPCLTPEDEATFKLFPINLTRMMLHTQGLTVPYLKFSGAFRKAKISPMVRERVIVRRGRFCYFEKNISDPGCHPGTVIELSEVIGPKGRFFKLIRDSAAGWDGTDPIRPFPDLSKF